ncbi:MAG: class I SAM-dependent methyltransferase [Solirubrobacterales bacterium]
MSLYGRFFARIYDRVTAASERAGLAQRRRALLMRAEGRVLEIGAGSGANVDKYPNTVTELVLTEPEEPMAARLDRRCAVVGRPARIVRSPAEALPFEDDSFDAVVCTLVLCTVKDPEQALAEIGRVLKSDGELLFLEHVRSSDPRAARWQDRLNPLQRRIGHGCNCNRRTAELIAENGFEIAHLEHGEIPKAPKYLRPLVTGNALLGRKALSDRTPLTTAEGPT